MLVLSRRSNESIRIKVGDVIVWVTVIENGPGKARLGFEAPADVIISREELVPRAERRHPNEWTG